MAGTGPGTLAPFLTPEGALVFTLTSNGYKFYTLNLVRALEAAGCPWRLCIFCADSASYTFFVREGILARKVQDLLPDFGPQVVPYIAKQFHTITRKKLELLEDLSSRKEVRAGVYLDGDIAIYRDPLPDLLARLGVSSGGAGAGTSSAGNSQLPAAANSPADEPSSGASGAIQLESPGILFQCDEKTRVACSRTLTPEGVCTNFCSGVIAWRHGAIDPSLFRIQGGDARAIWQQSAEDQVFLNTVFSSKGVRPETLPRNLYPNGQFASLFKGATAEKGEAILLHYNYIVGDQKRMRMKSNGDWRIPY